MAEERLTQGGTGKPFQIHPDASTSVIPLLFDLVEGNVALWQNASDRGFHAYTERKNDPHGAAADTVEDGAPPGVLPPLVRKHLENALLYQQQMMRHLP